MIGCDSMLYLDGELRGKPDRSTPRGGSGSRWRGRSGVLYTGHCVIRLRDGAVTHREVECGATTVSFGTPDATTI